MNHLHLAAAAAQQHVSAAEVHDIRMVGAIALPFVLIGAARSLIKERQKGRAEAEERAARTAELRATGAEWLAVNTTHGYDE